MSCGDGNGVRWEGSFPPSELSEIEIRYEKEVRVYINLCIQF